MSTQSEPGAPAEGGDVPLCVPELGPEDWSCIKEALAAGWVSSAGPYVDTFERTIADYVGARYAVATVSGTAALHIALLVAGVQPEDEVVVSNLTFIAPANAVRYVGAWPVFIDSEPNYWQMDPDEVVHFLENGCDWRDGALLSRNTGRRVSALLPVHILGHPADMDPILEIASRFGLPVVEDATESLGATYKGRMVGHLGDVACLSFNGNKLITTGGGGMLLTDRKDWADRARYLTTQAKDDPVEYIHSEIGYNYRLSSIQAALGTSQANKIDLYLGAKRRVADQYERAFSPLIGIETMSEAPWAESASWLYTIMVDEEEARLSSRTLMRHLATVGIQSRPLWQPMHLSRAHVGSGHGRRPVSERLYRNGLSLPSSVGLTEKEQDRVIESVVAVLNGTPAETVIGNRSGTGRGSS